MIKVIFCSLAVFCSFCFGATAQINPIWKEYKEIDGIASNYIYDLQEDKHGLLWLATENGLVKFDSYHAVRIPQIVDSLGKFLPVYYVYLMPDDRFWIGTKSGIWIYDPRLYQLVEHSFDFSHPVEDILYLGENKVLVSFLHGVHLITVDESYNPISQVSYDFKQFGNDVIVNEFFLHNQDLLISLVGYGVIKGKVKDLGEWDNFKLINNPFKTKHYSFETCKSIERLSSDEVLINYITEGLFIYNVQTDQFRKVPGINKMDNPALGPITASYFDGDYIYYSQINMGLFRILFKKEEVNPELISFGSIPSFNFLDDIISSIYVRSNVLWVTTVGDGLKGTFLQTGSLTTIPLQHHIGKHTNLNSIATTSSDEILVGTFGKGIIYLREDDTERFSMEKIDKINNRLGLPNDSISEVLFDQHGDLWIGTFNGLCHYSKEQYAIFESGGYILPTVYAKTWGTANFSSDQINDIFEDASGNIYAATQSGLNFINRGNGSVKNNLNSQPQSIFGKTQPINYGDFLGDSSIIVFSLDVNGIIKDDILSSHENLFPDTYNVYVFHSVVGKDGITWLATNKGLYKYLSKEGKTVDFHEKDFFKNKKINSIIEDDSGILWMGTNQGVFSLSPKSGRINQYKVPGENGWPFFHYGSVNKDNLGNIYFGTNKGVVKIATFQLEENKTLCGELCKIIVSDILINNQPQAPHTFVNNKSLEYELVNIGKGDIIDIKLGYPAHHLGDNIQFKYSIDGHNWFALDTSSPHVLLYQLAPGQYDLLLQGTKFGGEVVSASVIPLFVKGPWYKSWWAFVIYCIAAGLIMALYYRHRLYSIKLQQQLELEQMDRMNQSMKLEFVSNISHEFRTPLTLILNHIDIIKRKGFLKEVVQLDKIEANAQRLKKLANELIDVKKLEKEGVKLMVSQQDIVSFVQGITRLFEELAIDNNISLDFKTNKDVALIWFNKDQFEKILINLLSNSFKFTPAYGSITVTLDCQSEYNSAEAVSIAIHDSGVGIDETAMDKVFNPNYSSSPINPNGFKSAGIGLHLCKQLVELHHGKILLKSKKEAGTIFTVVLYKGSAHFKEDQLLKTNLPYKEHITHLKLLDIKNAKRSTSKVLVVEDNEDIRQYIVEVLSEYYDVSSAKSGIDGIEVVKSKLPDLIITDLSMPGKDGLTLIHEVKNDERTNHIPIIVLSAFLSDRDKLGVLAEGADLHLAKPFDNIVLLASVQNLLQSRASLKETFSNAITDLEGIAYRTSDSDLLKRAMAIINKYMEDPYFDVATLARKLKVSRSLLYLKFPDLVSYSPKEFIHVMRVRKGAKLLRTGNYNINETSDEIGYNSVKNFRKYFKDYFGVSPSSYIKNLREKINF